MATFWQMLKDHSSFTFGGRLGNGDGWEEWNDWIEGGVEGEEAAKLEMGGEIPDLAAVERDLPRKEERKKSKLKWENGGNAEISEVRLAMALPSPTLPPKTRKTSLPPLHRLEPPANHPLRDPDSKTLQGNR